jgi:filamentous hemagglutinin family protein
MKTISQPVSERLKARFSTRAKSTRYDRDIPRRGISWRPALTPVALAVGLAIAPMAPAYANPTGPQVAAGAASFSTAGNALTVTNAPGTIINWQSFSIGAGEITRFQQQSALSAVLNRVTGANPSSLLGTLSSNGRVFLVNPHGILVGQGAVIETAGFIASTLNIRDEDFLAGRLRFEGGGQGVLRNEGAIRASGDIFLVGPRVENTGLIRSDNGSVLLAAGQSVTITSPDAHGVQFALQAPSDSALNLGTIEARNAAGMFAGTLRHSGEIRATSASVDASGRVVLAAQKDAILEGNALVTVDNTGGRGGRVEITGERVGLFDHATVTARGATGGGEILVGGDYQGANPAVRNAAMTHVASGATLDASATASGDGGRIIVWADDTARMHGSVFARGGEQGGSGGFIETSGKRFLDVSGINVSAAGQTPGTWLLDPYNIEIVAGGGTVNNSGTPAFTPGGDDSQIGADLIVGQLNAGTSVTISTGLGGSPGMQAGNLTVSSPVVKTAVNNASLTLTAQNDIAVNADITLPGANSIATFNAGNDFSISSATVQAAKVSVTAGGNITRSGVQADDFLFRAIDHASFALNSTGGAIGAPGNAIRFRNSADTAGRGWTVSTSAPGAAGDIYVRYTGNRTNTYDGVVQTHAGTTQTVRLEHTGTGNIEIYGNITGNDDWIIDSAGGYGFAGATLFANSVNATFGGVTNRVGTYPLIPAFDTSASNGNITITARDIEGTGCGGSQVGVGVKPGTGLVSATATAPNSGCGGSIQLMHFGGDLLTSRYTLNFSNAAVPGNYVRLKAADGHLIVDGTAGFDPSLNNKEILLQTLAAGKDILFQGGTVQGGRVEVRAARNIDNLAPGTDGFIQTNAFGGPHWMLVAGGGIGPTNPVEGQANWVGSLVTSGAGAAGDIRVKFTGGTTPRIGEVRTAAGSAQNIDIQSTVGLIFSTAQPGYVGVGGSGSSSSSANDHYTVNATGSIFFDNFDNSFTANTITMTSGGSIVHGVSGGGDMMATTGLLTLNANGGSIGGAANYARLRGTGPQLLYALNDVYVDAGTNPPTLAGISTGPGTGTIGLRTTSTTDLVLGGTNSINDALVLTIGGNIVFPAAANFTTSGGLGLNSPTQIASTATVNVTGGTLTATQPVTNAGTLSTGIAGTTTLAAAFHNTGTLDVNAGTVNLASGGTSTGTFDAAPGATINFSGGTHNLGDGSILTGGGTIGYTGGTLNLNGGGAGTTVAAGTTLSASGRTFGGSGKLVNQGIFNLANSTVSGSLDNQGTLNSSGSSAVNGALDLTSGTLNLVSGTLTKGGAAADWIGGTITGAGTYTGGLTFTGGGARVLNGPTLNVPNLLLPGGSLDVQGGALNLSGASQIAAGAALSLTGGTFSASGTLLNNGTLTKATGGVTTLSALLTNNGDLNINAGTLRVSGGLNQAAGNVSIGSGATLHFPSGTSSTWNGGSLTQAALSSLVLLDNATLTLNGDVTNSGTWQTQFTANLAGTGTLTNTGKLNLYANFLSFTPAVISANIVNQGVLETRDAIQINGAFSNAVGATMLNNDAAVTVANGFTNAGTLELYSDLAELPPSFTVASGTLTNTGTIITTGSVNQDQPLAAQLNNQGTITANVGRLVVNKPGAAHVNTGTINATGADVLFQQSGGGTLTHSGGTITANPGRSITATGGPMDWQGGTLAGTGSHNYSGGLTFGGSGARVLNGPTLGVAGPVLSGGSLEIVSGALNLSGAASIAAGSTLLLSGGTLTSSGTLANAGTFTKASAGTTTIAGAFTNTGAVNANAGVLAFAGGYTQTAGSAVLGGGAVSGNVALDGGTFGGTGTLTGNLVNNGGALVVGASPGTLTINGDYTQGAAGVLNIELGGTTQGVNYDLLQVTGTANLGGTLNVSLFGGFTGTAGDLFDVITYGSRTGNFATVNFPAGYAMTATPNVTFYQLLMDALPGAGGAAGLPDPPLNLAASDVRVLQDAFFATVEPAKEPDEEKKSAVLECR